MNRYRIIISANLENMFRFIPTNHTGIFQTFGKFTNLCPPGLNFYIPLIQKIDVVSHMVQNKEFKLRVKTKDNVFTDLSIGVQYKIGQNDAHIAFFSLDQPSQQLDMYVQNSIRSKIPTMDLKDLFSSQNEIGSSVKESISSKMADYGYEITDVLINEVTPDKTVMVAMNDVYASQKMMEAAKNQAESEYIQKVKAAEADTRRMILQGEGTAGQRRAILDGYEKGVANMAKSLGMSEREIVKFILETQRLDMLRDIGKSQNTKTVFLNHNLESDLKTSIMQANEV